MGTSAVSHWIGEAIGLQPLPCHRLPFAQWHVWDGYLAILSNSGKLYPSRTLADRRTGRINPKSTLQHALHRTLGVRNIRGAYGQENGTYPGRRVIAVIAAL